jgi:hypothetical protein
VFFINNTECNLSYILYNFTFFFVCVGSLFFLCMNPDEEYFETLVSRILYQIINLYSTQVSLRWMYGRQMAMKDVVDCDKLRGVVSKL